MIGWQLSLNGAIYMHSSIHLFVRPSIHSFKLSPMELLGLAGKHWIGMPS